MFILRAFDILVFKIVAPEQFYSAFIRDSKQQRHTPTPDLLYNSCLTWRVKLLLCNSSWEELATWSGNLPKALGTDVNLLGQQMALLKLTNVHVGC